MSKKGWTVYILCCADQSLYTGITTDLERRFNEHQSQGPKCAKYLRGRGPLTLAYTEYAKDRASASQRELEIKKLNRAKKLQLLAANSSNLTVTEHSR